VYCVANVCNRDVNETVASESVNNIDDLHSKRCMCNFAMKQKASDVNKATSHKARELKAKAKDFQHSPRPGQSQGQTRPRRGQGQGHSRHTATVLDQN